ncbi:MAG: hypothetical protein LBP85_07185 [Prevotellaceae bacterium]|jgi:hypothetical protein|nr:hypothetical protein [Prevotellaceae bacterium]
MTAYSEIKKLPDEFTEMLVKCGFLKSTFKRNVAIYERYLEYREHGELSTDAVVHAADDFGISDRHVFRIVQKFTEIPV